MSDLTSIAQRHDDMILENDPRGIENMSNTLDRICIQIDRIKARLVYLKSNNLNERRLEVEVYLEAMRTGGTIGIQLARIEKLIGLEPLEE